jgi:hypothetical protein
VAINSGTTAPVAGTADRFGSKLFNVPTYRGCKSYVNGVGDILSPSQFGFGGKILAVFSAFSVSGTYYAWPQPAGPGQTTWHLRWMVVATGEEVFGGADLSAEILQLVGIGV